MFKEFKVNNLANFPKELEKLLDIHREKIDTITKLKSNNYADILKPMQDMDEELSLFFTPLSHLNSIMNSDNTQKAYENSLPLLSKFSSEVSQNLELFKKIESLSSNDLESQKVIDNDIKDFKLSGVNLPIKEKKELEDIDMKLSELSNKFSQNLLNATNDYELIIKSFNDVKELPQNDLDSAKITLEDGTQGYKFTLQIPSYMAYITYGSSREYREEIYRAYSSRAPQNSEVINQILSLKNQKSKLLGFDNFADYSIAFKDASSSNSVIDFLEKLVTLALPYAKDELQELKEFAKKSDNIESLQSFDVAYYSEKLKKEKFDFDNSMTKPYFVQEKVLNGMLDIISELFDLTIKEVTDVKKWHKCVRIFDIYENEKVSSRIYFDLEARKEKRGGAWMNDFETHYIDANNIQHLASAFVVCNFSPTTDTTPSLLRHDDVVTLFHEMGHAIHHLFSKVNQRSVSGINGVAWDVIEFPSQFLENFAYESAILKRFAFHYETNESISDELLFKIKDTKNYQVALGLLRQVEFALFDFKLHQKLYQKDEIQDLLDSIREKTALLKPPAYNKFQNGFAHIFAGGYSAGYYSYKWAEVLSADAFFECIDENNGFNKTRAKEYKNNILSCGGSKDMSELYNIWLKREAKVESLIKLYGLE